MAGATWQQSNRTNPGGRHISAPVMNVSRFVLCSILLLFEFIPVQCVQWLKESFIIYLDEWEEELAKDKSVCKRTKSRMMLSRETREGLNITS